MVEPTTGSAPLLKRKSTLLSKSKDRDEIFFNKFSLQQILQTEEPLSLRKTRIVCTIG